MGTIGGACKDECRAVSVDEVFFFFFFDGTATTKIYTLSLDDALPVWMIRRVGNDPFI